MVAVAGLGLCIGFTLLLFIAGLWVFLGLLSYWRGYPPSVTYHPQSELCKFLAQTLPPLQDNYRTPLWGHSGHLQTLVYGLWGRCVDTSSVSGDRRSLIMSDGTTVYYDLFQPVRGKTCDHVILLVPGIGNCVETDYIKAFAKFAVDHGYRLVVFNHVGALANTPLTGNRVFTYGGTGDLAAVFEDVKDYYGQGTQFIGVGYSLGATILVKFLGEVPARQSHFVCAVSIGQSYDAFRSSKYYKRCGLKFERLYNCHITRNLLKLLRRHKDKLFSVKETVAVTRNESVEDSVKDRDANGFALDKSLLRPLDSRMWSAYNIQELDEHYSCRVMGFNSSAELYKWSSCSSQLFNIQTLPLLLVNAVDDPIVMEEMLDIPVQYTGYNRNAMFVKTKYGGHLGFFEGSLIPHPLSWVERLLFEYFSRVGNRN